MSVTPTKYVLLLRILDALRSEATGTKWETQYAIGSEDLDKVQQARSRAFIHLYLKVMFGLSSFSEREVFVTDGSQDGGVDGYYIDFESKRIYLLQSKFRNTEHNFEQKEVEPAELLAMDIDRITRGHTAAENGTPYNGKVQGLIRRISEIPDVARYNYHVAIIANCTLPANQVRKLTDGFNATIFNYERSYSDLVFPIVSGTFFRAEDVTIQLDLDNKSAGAKTSYSVETPGYMCEITVLFIPTIEIAKAMDKYRNSILEYNPRSYLDLQDGKHVHAAIKETLLRAGSNEFALMNNGITILSDETNISERIGQRNKAQLRLLRPQIINGGQTAYTLSRSYTEDREGARTTFAGKEVLTKIITLTSRSLPESTAAERLRLIEEISVSSNRQAPVVTADRAANNSVYAALQRLLFERYGILYERKRGEFSDGVKAGYVEQSQIMERNLFLRILLSTRGDLVSARRRRIFMRHELSEADLTEPAALDAFADGFALFQLLAPMTIDGSQPRYREVLAKVFIGVNGTDPTHDIEKRLNSTEALWSQLLMKVATLRRNFAKKAYDPETGTEGFVFSQEKWIASGDFERDIKEFVRTGGLEIGPNREPLTRQKGKHKKHKTSHEAEDLLNEEASSKVESA